MPGSPSVGPVSPHGVAVPAVPALPPCRCRRIRPARCLASAGTRSAPSSSGYAQMAATYGDPATPVTEPSPPTFWGTPSVRIGPPHPNPCSAEGHRSSCAPHLVWGVDAQWPSAVVGWGGGGCLAVGCLPRHPQKPPVTCRRKVRGWRPASPASPEWQQVTSLKGLSAPSGTGGGSAGGTVLCPHPLPQIPGDTALGGGRRGGHPRACQGTQRDGGHQGRTHPLGLWGPVGTWGLGMWVTLGVTGSGWVWGPEGGGRGWL